MLDYPVFFMPEAARFTVRGASRNRNARIVSLLISAAIVTAIYYFFHDQLGELTLPILAISLTIPLLYLVAAVAREIVARAEASKVVDGLAFGVGSAGILTQGRQLPWNELGACSAVSRAFGRSDLLVITPRAGASVSYPLDFLSARPATIDGAIKALSGGRARVDFSRLDA